MTPRKTAEAEATEVEKIPEPEPETSGGGLSLQSLSDKVDHLAEIVRDAFKGGGDTPKKPATTSEEGNPEVAGQVKSELAKIREAEASEQAKESRMGEIEAKVKALAEKPPREYRKITNFLWGDDEK